MLTLLNQLNRVLHMNAGNDGDEKRGRDDGNNNSGKSKRRRVRFSEDPAEEFEIAPPSTTASQEAQAQIEDIDEGEEESDDRTLDSEDEEAIREEVRESGFFIARGDDDDTDDDDTDDDDEDESMTLDSEQEGEDRGVVRLKTREVVYPRELSAYELIIARGEPKAANRFVYNEQLDQTIEEFRATEDIKKNEIVLYFGGELVFASQLNAKRYPIKEVRDLYIDWSDVSRNSNKWQLASFVPTKKEASEANLRIEAMKPTKGSRSRTYKTAVRLVATRPIFKGERLYVVK